MKKLININICFAIVLTILVNTIVYFSFTNIYSSSIFNFENFNSQFENGIYQYRVFSGQLLIGVYEFLGTLNIDYDVLKLHFINPSSEPQMYLSFYILNTFFAILTAILLSTIMNSKWITATRNERQLLTYFGILIMAISQFVIVPYDYSSYFFILLFAALLLNYLEYQKNSTLGVLALIIILSTLNRESSALSISLAATLLLSKFGLHQKTLVPIAALTIAFVGTYLSIRFLGTSFTTNDGNLFIENLTQPKNWLGALFSLFLLIITLSFCEGKEQRKNIIIFHMISLPYIAMCFYSGILYEIRLYIPIFISCLLLTKLEQQNYFKQKN